MLFSATDALKKERLIKEKSSVLIHLACVRIVDSALLLPPSRTLLVWPALERLDYSSYRGRILTCSIYRLARRGGHDQGRESRSQPSIILLDIQSARAVLPLNGSIYHTANSS